MPYARIAHAPLLLCVRVNQPLAAYAHTSGQLNRAHFFQPRNYTTQLVNRCCVYKFAAATSPLTTSARRGLKCVGTLTVRTIVLLNMCGWGANYLILFNPHAYV